MVMGMVMIIMLMMMVTKTIIEYKSLSCNTIERIIFFLYLVHPFLWKFGATYK